MAHLQVNQPAGGVAPLEKLTNIEPENQNARGMLAGAYLALDRPTEAATQYRKLTALDASDAKAWYGLGKSYESLATRSLIELSKRAPQSAYVAVLLGDARLQRKQYRSAGTAWSSAGDGDCRRSGRRAPQRDSAPDLMPGNIMLTRSGVKLLDFGLGAHQCRTCGS